MEMIPMLFLIALIITMGLLFYEIDKNNNKRFYAFFILMFVFGLSIPISNSIVSEHLYYNIAYNDENGFENSYTNVHGFKNLGHHNYTFTDSTGKKHQIIAFDLEKEKVKK